MTDNVMTKKSVEKLSKISAADDRMTLFGEISPGLRDLLSGSFKSSDFVDINSSPKLIKIKDVGLADPLQAAEKEIKESNDLSTGYDILNRELKIPRVYTQIENKEKRPEKVELAYLSDRLIHEGGHARKSRLEPAYRLEKIKAIVHTLRILSPSYDEDEKRKAFEHGPAEAAIVLTDTSLIQEGYCIFKQREFLKKYGKHFDLSTQINEIDYKRSIENYLETGTLTGTITRETLPHHTGHWLYAKARQMWSIDIADYAFRLSRRTTSEPTGKDFLACLAPDHVLLISVLEADESEIDDCKGPEEEVKLLEKKVNKTVSPKPTASPGNTFSEDNYTIRERSKIAEHDPMKATPPLETNVPYLIPVFETRYPGKEHIHRPLFQILDSLYVVIKPFEADTIERSLWITEDAWKLTRKGKAKILDLAIRIWELVNKAYFPVVRINLKHCRYSKREVLDALEAESSPDNLKRVVPENRSEIQEIQKIFDPLEHANAQQERYQDLFENLVELGEAIKDGNEMIVRQYF